MQEVIYKGATRPALLLDMPMAPALGVAVAGLMVGFWAFYFTGNWLWIVAALAVVAPVLAFMRHVTRKDDQRVMQWCKWLLLQLRHRNRRLWGCRSYSPIAYDGKKDAD